MLNVPSDAVPAGQRRGRPDDVGGLARRGQRPLGLGAEQPARVGELQPAAGADEQRDAELGLEVGDLLGHARAGEVQRVRRGGERAVLRGGEEVGELLQRHPSEISYGACSQRLSLIRPGARYCRVWNEVATA